MNQFSSYIPCVFTGMTADEAIALVEQYIRETKQGMQPSQELIDDIEEYYGEPVKVVVSILTV